MSVLRVLTYHRVADPTADPMLHPRLVSAVPEVFALHLDHVARHYDVVAMADVVDAFRGRGRLPRRALLLTFDDAYRDFLVGAWPLLCARSLPATMFVPTALPSTPGAAFWWDRLHRAFAATPAQALDDPDLGRLPLATAAERTRSLARVQAHLKTRPHADMLAGVDSLAARLGEPPHSVPSILSWDDLRALGQAGLTLAPHSRTHPLLPRVDPETARAEIEGSIADLRREVGDVLPVFCYPSGAYDDAVVAAVRAAGIELAFTQDDGHNRVGPSDPLRLCRTNVTRRTTAAVLPLRLQSWFTHVDRWRHGRQARRRLAAERPAAQRMAS
jgi:peptidoglycan/xylan/chitin deacetylase (PgdA/CDA1 family)